MTIQLKSLHSVLKNRYFEAIKTDIIRLIDEILMAGSPSSSLLQKVRDGYFRGYVSKSTKALLSSICCALTSQRHPFDLKQLKVLVFNEHAIVQKSTHPIQMLTDSDRCTTKPDVVVVFGRDILPQMEYHDLENALEMIECTFLILIDCLYWNVNGTRLPSTRLTIHISPINPRLV